MGEQATDPAAAADAQLPDIDWARLPDGVRASTFAAPSGSLALISCGDPDAPPVLLVPGATGSKEDFQLMLPVLAAAGYHALSFDLAGQYESAAAGPEHLSPPREHYDYELFVDDLLALLADVGRAAHVVGYSFAGIVAGLAYAREPARFASLTLLSCPPLAGQSFRGVSRIGPVTGLATGNIGAALMIWGIRRNLVPVPPGRLRFVRARFALTRRQSVSDIVSLMKRTPDLGPILREAPLPKLVAVGEHDLWPTELHAEFARSLDAELAVYPAGHSPCETSPHQLCRDLLRLFAAAGR
ncbi:alpha/beta fold hydrolase [Microterricola viridarii]|uniref:Pimeloyl-ACP methyl ester carboxylesterase n=1 Tax=Microterricola viridarii TaxID=412690 RepID=A0A1H1YZL3_9MICO|nr:alpha/beta hydrolase [Microterricola viridarii]SDT26762.1 Pimeloyl-ACP methyl ester carboxylesterase [Microterricola viridarii]